MEEATQILGHAIGIRFSDEGLPSLNGPLVSALSRFPKGQKVFGKSLFYLPPILRYLINLINTTLSTLILIFIRWELMAALLQILTRILLPSVFVD